MTRELSRNELAEALRRQAQDAQDVQETSRNLGPMLPITLRLPKKTLTPGALQPHGKSGRVLGRQAKAPKIDESDNEIGA